MSDVCSVHVPWKFPNQVPSVSVSWAGVTVVERTLALMQKALEVDDRWRFFINLGHVRDGGMPVPNMSSHGRENVLV